MNGTRTLKLNVAVTSLLAFSFVGLTVLAAPPASSVGFDKGVYRTDQAKWTTGNAGSAFEEGDWASYQYVITGIPGNTAGAVPTFNVVFNHYQSGSGAVFIDAFTNFRYAVDTSPLADGTPFPPTSTTVWKTWLPSNINEKYTGSTCAGTDALNLPSADHCFRVVPGSGASPLPSMISGAGTHTLVIFYEAHLARTADWLGGFEDQLDNPISVHYIAPPSEAVPASVHGTNAYDGWTAGFRGLGAATGSSRNFKLQDQTDGPSGAVTLPIPAAAAGPGVGTGGITIIKDTVPNGAEDFSFSTSGGLVPSTFILDDDADPSRSNAQVYASVVASTYTVTEDVNSAASLVSIDCIATGLGTSASTNLSARTATIVLESGGAVTCTFTNNQQATLRVIKQVVNDDGGTLAPAAFQLHVKRDGVDVAGSPAAGSAAGTLHQVGPGTYAVSEEAVLGYSATIGGDCAADGSVTLAPGDAKTCTIINDDQAAHLRVIKHVINDDGGARSAQDWTLTVAAIDASPASFPGNESGTLVTLDAGSFAVTESGPAGYADSASADCSGTIALGETKTCTLTNDDIRPRLIVVKHVVADNGGSHIASDFTMHVAGASASPSDFPGDEAGTSVLILANAPFNVSESGPSGYADTFAGDCSGSLAPGDIATCLVTNDDQKALLHVIKHVVNDHGGSRDASDWTMMVSGPNASLSSFPGSEAGIDVYLDAGAYSVNETGPGGYASSLSSPCAGILVPGEERTCTITNDDIQPVLHVVKRVVNDNGGQRSASEFILQVTGSSPSPAQFAGNETGTTIAIHAGAFSVGESGPAGYAATLSPDCSGTLGPGDERTCTIINDDIQPILRVVKLVVNDHGGARLPSDWTMSVTAANASRSSFPGDESGTLVALDAGPYSVNETGPSGYAAIMGAECGGVLLPGDERTCTITNDDIQPILLVAKHVINDNGGTLRAPNWTLMVATGESGLASFPGNESGTLVRIDAGPFAVAESGPGGYSTSFQGDCVGVAAPGAELRCTFVNDDIQPRLRVVKHVVNDHGGLLIASDWALNVTGANVSLPSFPGSESGTLVTLDAGAYAVSETGPSGYAMTASADCAGLLLPGDERTCTLVNDDIQPTLLVSKRVINDHGGLREASDWSMLVAAANASASGFPGNESGTLVTLDAGAYSVSEAGPAGYAASLSADCLGILLPGDAKSCRITNDDIQPILHVIKRVVNDHGGLQAAGDWNLSVEAASPVPSSFPGDESGTQIALDAGPYSVSETGPAGYAASLSVDCIGSLLPGDEKTCTVTNDDIEPRLLVAKHVVADNGGPSVASDFTMHVAAINASQTQFPGNESGTLISLHAGAYNVTESGPAGYAGSLGPGCSGVLLPGDVRTCTITNDDIQPILHVIKQVVNDNGGLQVASDWILAVDGASPVPSAFPGNGTGTVVRLDVGRYSVNETGPSGYLATFSNDCAGTLLPGDEKTCLIINDDIQPILHVIKRVVNDNGGERSASDWTLSVAGANVSSAPFAGSEAGTRVLLDAGAFAVNETGPSGYAAYLGDDCSGILLPGDEKTCTVVNDDIQPMLLVLKHVVRDNGGLETAADFLLHVHGTNVSLPEFPGSESGVLVDLDADAYNVTESGPFGYQAAFSADCAGILLPGDVRTCTITNDDIQPILHVIKRVVNDNGGLRASSDWTMSVAAANVSLAAFPGEESGTRITLDAGAYAVNESGPSGYAASFSDGCVGTLAPGDERTCIVLNDDIQPVLRVVKHVINDHGGDLSAGDWILAVDGLNVSLASFPGNESGTLVALDAGAYSVNETGPGGYAASFGAECSGILVPGDEKTCTITNDDIHPRLLVIKHVVNDNGGRRNASSFLISVAGDGAIPAVFGGDESGVQVLLHAGSFVVSESADPGYAQALAGDCSGPIEVGQSLTCVVTNDDIQPTLIVVKQVVNDDGGRRSAANFTMLVSGTNVSSASFPGAASPGVSVRLDAGAYAVDEAPAAGYAKALGADCAGILAPGETRTCVITNNDIGPTRTQGFWQTHTAFTRSVFDGQLGGTMTVGAGAHTKVIDTPGKLFGAYYSDLAKKTTGQKRLPVDHARMVLLQQLVTAKLNVAAFGAEPATVAMIAAADAAYAGTSTALMSSFTAQLDAYNNSRDAMPISSSLPSPGKATPSASKTLANASGKAGLVFWDAP